MLVISQDQYIIDRKQAGILEDHFFNENRSTYGINSENYQDDDDDDDDGDDDGDIIIIMSVFLNFDISATIISKQNNDEIKV